MSVDRTALAKINRKLSTGLDTTEEWHMVRVPASEDVWVAWRNYCGKARVSMGRALSVLIERELRALLDDDSRKPIRAVEIDRVLREREADLIARERQVAAPQRDIRNRERRLSVNPAYAVGVGAVPEVGRNEPCPCGSGLKYKRCHGLRT